MTESWTEIRCPACKPLGFDAARMLYKVYGVLKETDAHLQIICPRCKSLIDWTIGKPVLIAVKLGKQGEERPIVYHPE